MAAGRWLALALCLVGCHGEALVVRPATSDAAAAPAVRELAHDVTVREVELIHDDTAMLVWVYRPPAAMTGPRPVVLIASAGAPPIWGMRLGEGDRAEHLPWAERGYIVVAYSLAGQVDDPQDIRVITAGIRAFVRAAAGLSNTRAALKLVLASEPRADHDRIYAVGFDSAGTLALRAGAELSEIKAIVALNPITDVDARVTLVRRNLVGIDRTAVPILRSSSPLEHVVELRKKPVFLFHSVVDEQVPVAESIRLARALAPLPEGSRVMVVPTGDHRRSMLEQGLPAAMAWLDARAGLPARPTP